MRALPNALGILRAIAVLPVVVLAGEPAYTILALVVFCVAALTDAVDGPFARRLGATSSAGAFLDPLADKILVLGTLLALMQLGAVEAWVVLVIFGRDILVTSLRALAATRGIAVEASAYGKAKTVVQFLAIAGLLLAIAVPAPAIEAAALLALAGALALTVASGIDVLLRSASVLIVAPADERLRADAG